MAIEAIIEEDAVIGYTDTRDVSPTKVITTTYDIDFAIISEAVTRKLSGEGLAFTDLDDEFQAAYNQVASDLPSTLASVETLKFEFEGLNYKIYNDVGILVGRVSSWTNQDSPSKWNYDENSEVVNVYKVFSFMDVDWKDIASTDNWERYVVETGTPLDVSTLTTLDEKKAAGLEEYSSGQSSVAALVRGDAENLGEWADAIASLSVLDSDGNAISSAINMVRIWSNEWTGLPNEWREDEQTNVNSSLEFFITSENNTWGEFVGSIEVRDDIMLIKDANWNTVSRQMSGDGLSFSDIYDNDEMFQSQWGMLRELLPDNITENQNLLKFVLGDASGNNEKISIFLEKSLVAQVDIWFDDNTTDKSNGTKITRESENIRIEDADGELIAVIDAFYKYEYAGDRYTDGDIIYSRVAVSSRSNDVASYQDEFDIDETGTVKWEDVSALEIGLIVETDDQGIETEGTRVRFIKIVDHEFGHYEEDLGTLEIINGVASLYDNNWTLVWNKLDGEGIGLDQIDDELFILALENASGYLPAELQSDDLIFVVDEKGSPTGVADRTTGETIATIEFDSEYDADYKDTWYNYTFENSEDDQILIMGGYYTDLPAYLKGTDYRSGVSIGHLIRKENVSADEWATLVNSRIPAETVRPTDEFNILRVWDYRLDMWGEDATDQRETTRTDFIYNDPNGGGWNTVARLTLSDSVYSLEDSDKNLVANYVDRTLTTPYENDGIFEILKDNVDRLPLAKEMLLGEFLEADGEVLVVNGNQLVARIEQSDYKEDGATVSAYYNADDARGDPIGYLGTFTSTPTDGPNATWYQIGQFFDNWTLFLESELYSTKELDILDFDGYYDYVGGSFGIFNDVFQDYSSLTNIHAGWFNYEIDGQLVEEGIRFRFSDKYGDELGVIESHNISEIVRIRDADGTDLARIYIGDDYSTTLSTTITNWLDIENLKDFDKIQNIVKLPLDGATSDVSISKFFESLYVNVGSDQKQFASAGDAWHNPGLIIGYAQEYTYNMGDATAREYFVKSNITDFNVGAVSVSNSDFDIKIVQSYLYGNDDINSFLYGNDEIKTLIYEDMVAVYAPETTENYGMGLYLLDTDKDGTADEEGTIVTYFDSEYDFVGAVLLNVGQDPTWKLTAYDAGFDIVDGFDHISWAA